MKTYKNIDCDCNFNGLLLVCEKKYHICEAPYNAAYKIIQIWKILTVTLSMVSFQDSVFILRINPYKR